MINEGQYAKDLEERSKLLVLCVAIVRVYLHELNREDSTGLGGPNSERHIFYSRGTLVERRAVVCRERLIIGHCLILSLLVVSVSPERHERYFGTLKDSAGDIGGSTDIVKNQENDKLVKIYCIRAGYVGGPTMVVKVLKCPYIEVTVVDISLPRITAWKRDQFPIYEPGLDEVVKQCRGKNLNVEKHLCEANIVFVSRVYLPIDPGVVLIDIAFDPNDPSLAGLDSSSQQIEDHHVEIDQNAMRNQIDEDNLETGEGDGNVNEQEIRSDRLSATVNMTGAASIAPNENGIDPTFLEALPEDFRAEVLASQQARSIPAPAVSSFVAEDIDPEFLAALPLDIQAEVLTQQLVGENWLLRHKAELVCHEKVVKMPCVPKELVGLTPHRRIGFRMELVQGAMPICEGSCRLTSLERQEVWNDCRSCKVGVGSNGNLLWEASVLLGRTKGFFNGHVEVYGYAFWGNQCTSSFHGVNESGGVRVAREDDRGVTKGREDVREVFQQRGSGAKRKLSRCGRNQMGNEPILALPEGADDFVVYYDARSKDLEACLEKGRRFVPSCFAI
ncbi:UDP-glucose 6-dehydrogenase 1-like protein [Tanacetum coccineum]|uniref:UDP-glucose 6-dehydrogenase 1-like protein n=1 Tax=Tanacetum coccineum TaxID=301880 RepID=A0ABQ4ZV44_9ASTR